MNETGAAHGEEMGAAGSSASDPASTEGLTSKVAEAHGISDAGKAVNASSCTGLSAVGTDELC
jgi:hypothetical protein